MRNKFYFWSVFFALFSVQLVSQELQLNFGKIKLEKNFDSENFFRYQFYEVIDGKVVRIIQFQSIPDLAGLEKMRNAGITILDYLPENAYVVRLTLNQAAFNTLSAVGAIAITEFNASYKLDKPLLSDYIPSHAITGSKARFEIQYFKTLSHDQVKSWLKSRHVSILSDYPTARTFVVEGLQNDYKKYAGFPFISFVQAATPASEPEDDRGRTLHRVNTINPININNSIIPNFDGTGVAIGLADDGYVGPHIDFKGRITQYTTLTGQTHGDMTAGIAVGAGNLNPTMAGMATGAHIHIHDISGYPHVNNAVSYMNNNGVYITSTSYSQGCNTYDVNAQQGDNIIYNNPKLLFVFSGGNNASGNCNYGAGAGWGNITGGYKQGKNVIAAGNVDQYDVIDNTSSRGPASDGRIKPDICANGKNQNSADENYSYQVGGGTSAACPGIAGASAILYQVYRAFNGGNTPDGALIKAILMNTAHDTGNPGPDFTYGFGRINVGRAYDVIKTNNYMIDSITQGQVKTFTFTLPGNLKKIKAMVYWIDPDGSPSAAKALVNDLDVTLTTPSAATILPWGLDTTPNAALLNANATRKADHLNNVEQITIDTIPAGNYTLTVTGTTVPLGKAKFYVVFDSYKDEIKLTYPVGGEGFVPGGTETIRWDNFYPNGAITLQYSTNGGANWTNISTTIAANARFYNWTLPGIQASHVLLRISNSSSADTTDTPFTIIGRPTNITFPKSCPDTLTINWNAATAATGYIVYRLGQKYMDSIGYSTTTSLKVPHMYLDTNWYSVASVINGKIGRRADAVRKLPGLTNCVLADDAEANSLIYPSGTLSAVCDSIDSLVVNAVFKNAGANPFSNVSFHYQFQGYPVVSETYTNSIAPGASVNYSFSTPANLSSASGTIPYKVWINYSSDQNHYNDTLNGSVSITTAGTWPLAEDFQGTPFPPTGWSLATSFASANWVLEPAVTGKSGSSTRCAKFDNYSLNQVGTKSDIISKFVDLGNGVNPKIHFDVAYVPYTGYYDTLKLSVAGSCSQNFGGAIYAKGGVVLMTDPSAPQNTSFSPTSASQWRTDTVSLNAYANGVVRIKFTNVNQYGNFLYLDNINIIAQNPTGINQTYKPRMFGLDPNPTNGNLHFSVDNANSNKISLKVFDLQGRLMLEDDIFPPSGQNFEKDYSISEFSPGTYLFRLMFEDKVYHYKIIKQ